MDDPMVVEKLWVVVLWLNFSTESFKLLSCEASLSSELSGESSTDEELINSPNLQNTLKEMIIITEIVPMMKIAFTFMLLLWWATNYC